jgi:acyl carrier protein phosphodiesterase
MPCALSPAPCAQKPLPLIVVIISMNFLAHLYLSGENHDTIIGNFIADHVKGNMFNGYNPGIQAGIKLHRSIDYFTDNHPVVKESVERIRPEFRKYAGVVVDMYFDHFLSAGWREWSEEPLGDFASRMYAVLTAADNILPPRTRQMLPYMMNYDWLSNYGNFEGLNRAFNGMARRTPFHSNMESASEKLRKDYDFYGDSFHRFFPELIGHAGAFREQVMNTGSSGV